MLLSIFAVTPRYVSEITPETDRRNGWLYVWTQLLIYFSAPVIYVGVVQAAFIEKLGASATLSNLPSATYFLGFIFPFICSWWFRSIGKRLSCRSHISSWPPRCCWSAL